MKRTIWILALLLLAGCTTWLVRTSRANTETAPYTLIRTDGPFELRDYPELTLATATMVKAGENGSFMRLFRYISGDNERSEAIAMTTPVLIDRRAADPGMSFVVPKAVVTKGAPAPKSSEVRMASMAAARYAACRFKGKNTSADEKAALVSLLDWCARQKLIIEGEPLYAYYDPPWTPAFLRRNEVLLKVHP